MHNIKRSSMLWLCLLIIIASCSSIPDIIQTEVGPVSKDHFLSLPDQSRLWDPTERVARINTLPESDRRLCPQSYSNYRKPYPKPFVDAGDSGLRTYTPNTMYFIETIYINLSLYLRTSDSKILVRLSQDLNNAAEAEAFLRIKPWSPISNYNPYNEPVFCQRTLLLALAFVSQAVFDSPDIPEETKINIRDWGDKLLTATEQGRDEMKPGSSDDRGAQRAATLAAWAAVTKNKDLFAQAIKAYWPIAARLSPRGGHRAYVGPKAGSWIPDHLQLRYNNMVLGYLSMTAEVAEQNRIPLYSAHIGKTTLHEAVRWHVMASIDPDFQNRTPSNQKKIYLQKKHSLGSENFAWLESYAARFPENPIVQEIHEITEPPIYGGYFGGFTACIYRPIE